MCISILAAVIDSTELRRCGVIVCNAHDGPTLLLSKAQNWGALHIESGSAQFASLRIPSIEWHDSGQFAHSEIPRRLKKSLLPQDRIRFERSYGWPFHAFRFYRQESGADVGALHLWVTNGVVELPSGDLVGRFQIPAIGGTVPLLPIFPGVLLNILCFALVVVSADALLFLVHKRLCRIKNCESAGDLLGD